jgi:hypothetical protein
MVLHHRDATQIIKQYPLIRNVYMRLTPEYPYGTPLSQTPVRRIWRIVHQSSGQGGEQGQPRTRLTTECPLIKISSLIQEVSPTFNFYHLHDESLQLPCNVTKITCAIVLMACLLLKKI